ncbi:methyltransferase domain-containing protein [Paenibacillus tianjinensis]|uniref:Methyltransferase domain-containing protein n=1 Tax=Paenibacillus tianjinensis TaxID=2810347 RepID=A0ABX7L7P8_9BACL|nr:methyltransferase domain-containing protein [Paenibacillus tianjinensis]QSF43383.1 methyltransferase domain-containing protein [Paenibacillus tianjinensis]
MLQESGDWKFDSEVVPIFDEHVRLSVPLYEEIHNMITEMSYWFAEDFTNIYDIGTSTGETIHNLSIKHKNKNIKYIGVDSSESMVIKARQRFDKESSVTILNQDVSDSNFAMNNASYITAVLSIMFISQRQRQDLIHKIYNSLNYGGAFVMIEKVVGSNARFDEMWIELYHDLKLKNGLKHEEVIAKSQSIRGILKPYTVDENISMLKKSGFTNIDTFFKWNNFAGFIAIKL